MRREAGLREPLRGLEEGCGSMRIALAGDTMLGRGVAERLSSVAPSALFSDEIAKITRAADLFVLNLECCISTRGERWPQPGKPFFFRAPPAAVEALQHLGVDCVTLANNHALDFGYDALLDTFDHLGAGGIGWTGAGRDSAEARAPVILQRAGARIALLGVTDHPADFAATEDRPGVAFAGLRRAAPRWLDEALASCDADITLVLPHWGPNMNPTPLDYVRAAAERLVRNGATLVAGHSAHVFQGATKRVLYDLGDFIDDYATDPLLRNDLGLLWVVDIDGDEAASVEAFPLKLDYCHTRLAEGKERDWIAGRLEGACGPLGTQVERREDRLVIVPS